MAAPRLPDLHTESSCTTLCLTKDPGEANDFDTDVEDAIFSRRQRRRRLMHERNSLAGRYLLLDPKIFRSTGIIAPRDENRCSNAMNREPADRLRRLPGKIYLPVRPKPRRLGSRFFPGLRLDRLFLSVGKEVRSPSARKHRAYPIRSVSAQFLQSSLVSFVLRRS